jgi:hypothetical protein
VPSALDEHLMFAAAQAGHVVDDIATGPYI